MFVDCPACLDPDGAARCGLPAEVRCRFTMRSTDGPLDSIMIRCPAGHQFSGPVALLTPDRTGNPDQGTAGARSRAARQPPARPGRPRRRRTGTPQSPHRAATARSPPEQHARLLPGPTGHRMDHRHAPRAAAAPPPIEFRHRRLPRPTTSQTSLARQALRNRAWVQLPRVPAPLRSPNLQGGPFWATQCQRPLLSTKPRLCWRGEDVGVVRRDDLLV